MKVLCKDKKAFIIICYLVFILFFYHVGGRVFDDTFWLDVSFLVSGFLSILFGFVIFYKLSFKHYKDN